MRLDRTTIAGAVAIAIVTAGCSNGASTPASSSSQSPTSSSQSPPSTTTPSASAAAGGPLDQSTCLDVSFAKDNLMVANNPEKARKYADTLEKYGPPDNVKAAIEHFVTTGGARPDDPDLNANRDLITGWIKQVCPNVNP
ncbi:hypothetical protein [Mycobacterium sp. ACS4054]|uniref:hypothetical protein n=1 Tax=Mycobacterium sp. ACS4054 TaxID=1834119 RepID=UPI0012EAF1A4|nr:hypothetical protein [Mycobacterium sp. ACS4054]